MAKYCEIWTKYLPAIYLFVDKSLFYNKEQTIVLDKQDFQTVGKRYSSGYSFRIEIKNGKVVNNISGTIVARDLFDVLAADEQQKNWLLGKEILITVDKKFNLKINCIV